jgi:hypothetical protein
MQHKGIKFNGETYNRPNGWNRIRRGGYGLCTMSCHSGPAFGGGF